MERLLLHSYRTVLPHAITEAWVLVDMGIIISVSKEQPDGNDYRLVELGELLLMPGVIDPHVHVNEPGRTSWEGFETATKAALVGGVTTIVDMPLNASPVTTTAGALEQKLMAARDQLHVNVGFWGGIVPGNEGELTGLLEGGVLGFKAFLTHSGIDDFPNVTEYDLRKVMPIIAESGIPLLVHCELEDAVNRPGGDARLYSNYLATRPERWEVNAINLVIGLCKEYCCRVHIVHLSAATALKDIELARAMGLPLTVETGQHYLYFDAEHIGEGQTVFKCAPPIRHKQNQNLLWQALKEGIIDFVATDHSPTVPENKALTSGDFLKAWGGIASLQFALPVLWTAARQRDLGWQQMVRWLCEEPAKLIGKADTKGKIAAGYDADLIVVNDAAGFVVTEAIIQHKHKLTPYLNETLYGVVEQTYLAGVLAFEKGKIVQLNAGKLVVAN